MDKLTEPVRDEANKMIASRRMAAAISSGILAILILLTWPDIVFGQGPAITISKTPDAQTVASGGTATFTIRVENIGGVPLSNVTVSDPNAPNCDRVFASIGVGGLQEYTCTVANVTAGFTNTATADSDETDPKSDKADVAVANLAISKTPDAQTVASGGTATFTIQVDNTGEVPLSNVTVSDPNAPDCNRTFASIGVGGFRHYTCTVASVTAGFTNTATADSDETGAKSDTAAVAVANLAISKTPDAQTVASGGTATFTIRVDNTGGVPLSNVTVSDPNAPNCDRIFASIGVGGFQEYTCTVTNVMAGFTNVATADSDQTGPKSDTAAVALKNLVISKTPDAQTVASGGTATFTIRVDNTGEVPLSNVTVSDPNAPNCDRIFASIGVGGFQEYTCTVANVTAGFTNTASVTGTPPTGPDVSDSDTADVSIAAPAIAIVKTTNGQDANTPPGPYVQVGDTVTWRYHVTNIGNVTLTGIRVLDSHLGPVTCDEGPIPDLGPVPLPLNPSIQSTVEVRVAASTDDAEENASGNMSLASSDLELVVDGSSNQLVGMRFNGVNIPPGADITNAYVQFQADEIASEATSLIIQGQDIDNAPTFTSATGNISSRSRTTASVSWAPVPWTTVGEAGLAQRTPDIASVVQEIVNRPSWSSGNSLVVIISGTGRRTAESYDGVTAAAPLLHIEFTSGSGSTGESFICTTSGVATAGQYANTGWVTAKDPYNRDITDSDVSHYFGIRPRLAIDKAADVASAVVGSTIKYTYVVTNIGNVPLRSIVITDDKLGSISLGTTTLSPGISTTGVAEYTVVSSDLPGPLQNTAWVTGTWVVSSDVTASATGVESVAVSPLNYTYLPIIGGDSCVDAGDIGFESGNFSGWAVGGQLGHAISSEAHCGNWAALLGEPGYSCDNVPVDSAWMSASFLVPNTNSPSLTFYYRTLTYDSNPGLTNKFDSFDVLVAGSLGFRYANQIDVLSCSTLRDSGWQRKTIDLSAHRGQNITIKFENHNRHDNFYNTWTYIDDITLRP